MGWTLPFGFLNLFASGKYCDGAGGTLSFHLLGEAEGMAGLNGFNPRSSSNKAQLRMKPTLLVPFPLEQQNSREHLSTTAETRVCRAEQS